jgi:transposase
MPTSRPARRLWDAYRFQRLRPSPTVIGIFGEPHARIITLTRRSKRACGTCGQVQRGWYDRRRRRIRDLACGDLRIYLDVEVRRVACPRCGTVKQERLAFLADNPFYI